MSKTANTYFSRLSAFPVRIAEPGKYITRGGDTVEVVEVVTNPGISCFGAYANGVAESWHRSGRIFANIESLNDIVAAA